MSHSPALEEAIHHVIRTSLARFQHSPQVSALVQERWRIFSRRLLKLGKVSYGNKLTVFFNKGDEAFESLWKSMCSSTKHIFMEMYTIDNDTVGKRTLEHLASAKGLGAQVYLIYDGLGSMSLSQRALAALRGSTFVFNPVFTKSWWPWWPSWKTILNRNHRKIVSIDSTVGYIGGMNISEKYAGSKLGTGYFRDLQVRIEGPAAADLEAVAHESLTHLQKSDPTVVFNKPVALPLPLPDVLPEGAPVLVFDSNFHANKYEIQKGLLAAINAATTHLYVTTPYFLPPAWLKKGIIRAARRGVDVRIITAGCTDVPAVRFAAQHIYSAFLKRGVRIYEMHGAALHAKMFLVDGIFGCAGSFNFDLWSTSGNLETNIGVFDAETLHTLEEQFLVEQHNCREVTLKDLNARSYLSRAFHWFAYHCIQLVRPPRIKKIANDMVKNIRKKKKNKSTFVENS